MKIRDRIHAETHASLRAKLSTTQKGTRQHRVQRNLLSTTQQGTRQHRVQRNLWQASSVTVGNTTILPARICDSTSIPAGVLQHPLSNRSSCRLRKHHHQCGLYDQLLRRLLALRVRLQGWPRSRRTSASRVCSPTCTRCSAPNMLFDCSKLLNHT